MPSGVETKINMDTIGGRIKYARKRKKMTQQCLCDEMGGADISNISRIERGLQIPLMKTINSIADALGVDPEWITTGEGSMDMRY